MKTLNLLALSTLLLTSALAQANERPPQYVVISFDGSRSVQMWNETRELAREAKMGITVFMSGVHFVSQSVLKKVYQAPGKAPGQSAIKVIFDNDKATIPQRIEQIEGAVKENIEIGSHAVGHFDGGKWSYEAWKSEMTQFARILLNIFEYNSLPELRAGQISSWKTMIKTQLRGFRAPLLARNAGADRAIGELGYTYDGSRVSAMGVWPYRDNGLWQLPMATIPIVGTAKKTIAMDYNFYVSDSNAIPDLAKSEIYRKRWLASLRNYFNQSYYGNRAPIHVGAHFDDWNGRAYFTGTFQFAREVCAMPEVKCVTGQQLVNELNKMPTGRLAQLQAGNFQKKSRPNSAETPETFDLRITWAQSAQGLKLAQTGVDQKRLRNETTTEVYVDRQLVSKSLDFALPQDGIKTISIVVKRGQDEILTSTRKVQIINGQLTQLQAEDQEARVLKGDLPEAHGHQHSHEEGPRFWDI